MGKKSSYRPGRFRGEQIRKRELKGWVPKFVLPPGWGGGWPMKRGRKKKTGR